MKKTFYQNILIISFPFWKILSRNIHGILKSFLLMMEAPTRAGIIWENY